MIVPSLIHFSFNNGLPTERGYGIPMATDIAFALGVLSLAGSRIPVALKIFLTAFAIIDDLGAIAVIAIFYTSHFSFLYFGLAIALWVSLFVLGRKTSAGPAVYLMGGVLLWYFLLRSGIHPTISGVLLAFAIPFRSRNGKSLSDKLQERLHIPVAFFILPLFALANTAIVLPQNIAASISTPNSLGIMLGLFLGKPIGIIGASLLAISLGWGSLSASITRKHLIGVGILGGIGFTMSIFITDLAFQDRAIAVASRISILIASAVAAVIGWVLLRSGKTVA
jgi:NhaA family Na+:H+ antiporter